MSAKTPTAPATITLEWDLTKLPSAQHKAGLAGLVLQIRSMCTRKLPADSIPEEVSVTERTAKITFTEQSFQGLMDDFYDAEIVEALVASKWAGTDPKREQIITEKDPVSGKEKNTKKFVYDVVSPSGHFLAQYFPDEKGLWHKLWRDFIWNIVRGVPATRNPFNERSAKQPCKSAAAEWKDLVASSGGKEKFDVLSGSQYLGAQAVTAESVAFSGSIAENFLLHFWVIASLVYTPQVIDREGKGEFTGYSVSIPEISDLDWFCEVYPKMLSALDKQALAFRPRAAVISLPEEGTLLFQHQLAVIAGHHLRKREWHQAVSAVAYFHMDRPGNAVKMMAHGVLPSRPQLIHGFDQIKEHSHNALYRAARLRALLQDQAWYQLFSKDFAERPWEFFIRAQDTPPSMRSFPGDVARHFKLLQENHQLQRRKHQSTMNQEPTAKAPNRSLDLIIYDLMKEYVRRKAEAKSGKKYESFKDNKKDGKTVYPPEYTEAQQKVCADAFLAFRSRRERDFSDYFTATIGSVSQYLPPEEFQILASNLLGTGWQDIKTLAMLALSANSPRSSSESTASPS